MFLFISKCIIVTIDKNDYKDIEKDILKNTDIKDIEYINKYDNYYIVMDKKKLYLYDNKYNEITNIDVDKLYENKNNYDIVYRNETIVYMDDYKSKKGLIFKYYDIYNYKLIDEIVVGGI